MFCPFTRVLTSTWVALLFSMLAYNADLKSIQGIQSTALGNYLFASVMCVLILPYVSISLYTADRQMYLQDASAKRYRASSYYLAKVCAVFCSTDNDAAMFVLPPS